MQKANLKTSVRTALYIIEHCSDTHIKTRSCQAVFVNTFHYKGNILMPYIFTTDLPSFISRKIVKSSPGSPYTDNVNITCITHRILQKYKLSQNRVFSKLFVTSEHLAGKIIKNKHKTGVRIYKHSWQYFLLTYFYGHIFTLLNLLLLKNAIYARSLLLSNSRFCI